MSSIAGIPKLHVFLFLVCWCNIGQAFYFHAQYLANPCLILRCVMWASVHQCDDTSHLIWHGVSRLFLKESCKPFPEWEINKQANMYWCLSRTTERVRKPKPEGENKMNLNFYFWIAVIVGEIANFVAYAFAAAILVTPLGALSIIVR